MYVFAQITELGRLTCIRNKECGCGRGPDFALEHACESQVNLFEGKISYETQENSSIAFWLCF